jgi:hypothetical protein
MSFRTLALTGQSHLGKRSFIEDEIRKFICDEDILIADLSVSGSREALLFATSNPILSPYKVVLVDNADGLSDVAKDAYLKLCEEPPDKCRIFLILEDDGLLPDSLQSRLCHVIRWGLLNKQEMNEFGQSLDHVPDSISLELCHGRPGLYSVFLKSNEYINLRNCTRLFINGSIDPLIESIPSIIKELKSGASLEREAIAWTIAFTVREYINDSSKHRVICNLLKFSTNLLKIPSVNADIHWQSSLLNLL